MAVKWPDIKYISELEPHLNMAHIRGIKKSYPGCLYICNNIQSVLEFSIEIDKCSLNALTKINNIVLLSATKIYSFNRLNQWAVSQTACFLVL